MEALMRKQIFGARQDGVDVVITLGDKECRMEYKVALHLAAMLYSAGKQAKSAAGDQSMEIIGLARLTDANLDEMQAQRSRDGTAVFAHASR